MTNKCDTELVAPCRTAFAEMQPVLDLSTEIEMGIEDIPDLQEEVAFALSGAERPEEQALKEMAHCAERVCGNPTYPLDGFPGLVGLNIIDPAKELIGRRGETLDAEGEKHCKAARTVADGCSGRGRLGRHGAGRRMRRPVSPRRAAARSLRGHPGRPAGFRAPRAEPRPREDGERHLRPFRRGRAPDLRGVKAGPPRTRILRRSDPEPGRPR